MHEKIQKVSRDVLYVYQPTYEIWGRKLQNWGNAIKGAQAQLPRNKESKKPDFYDAGGFVFL